MMKLWKACGVVALFLAGPVSTAAQTVGPLEPLRLTVDIARFRGADDKHVQVEVYYAFPRRGITYSPDSAGLVGAADVALIIKRADSVLHADRWLVPHVLRDTSAEAPGLTLVGNYGIQLEQGEYHFKIYARDRNNPNRRDSVTLKVPIRPYATETPALSDIEFASTIRQGGKGGTFYKNTLEVIPNVGGVYAEDQACFLYAEAYNLLAGDDKSDYVVRMNVFDAVGKEIISREKPRKRVAESSVLVDNFPASRLRTGTYTLLLAILDSAKKPLAQSGKKFYVYNKTLGVDSTLLASAASLPFQEYMAMDEAELDREWIWAKYESTDEEKGQYEKLKGVETKRKYLTDFWRRRTPGLRPEYLSRVAYANSNFQMMSREGYKTDRGRVYVVYGPPDDIERHPNETDMRPYEIWAYHNIQGGVIFVFVLRNAGGDHELVHSTHRNELHDENWDRIGISR